LPPTCAIMRCTPFVLLCFALLGFAAYVRADAAQYEKLIKETKTSPYNILDLNNESLRAHLSAKRSYSIVTFFTMSGPEAAQHCPQCPEILQDYREFVRQFQQKVANEGGYNGATFQEHPVFFAVCDFQKCRDLVMEAAWRALPQLAVLTPRGSTTMKSLPVLGSFLDDSSPSNIATFVKQQTGFDISISVPLYRVVGPYVIGLVLIYVAVRLLYEKFHAQAKKPLFWFIPSLGVFAFSMAGVVFNMIHSPMFSYRNPQNGQFHYIYPSARHQFVLEGLIMAVVLSSLVLVLVGVGAVVPSIRDPVKQRVSFGFLVAAYFILWTWLMSIFRAKYNWYPF